MPLGVSFYYIAYAGLFVVLFILLIEMIKFFKKLNKISLYDVRYIIRMARDEFREPNSDSDDD